MSDYISREAATEGLAALARKKFSLSDSFQTYLDALKDADDLIRSIPAADVREVGRGKWERRLYTQFGPKLNDILICSNCGIAFSTEVMIRRSYCPNCGAQMEVLP